MKLENETMAIEYSDNGTGLPKVFENNKENIFLPLLSDKKEAKLMAS
jgi:nitrogen-specific signal transduction histidine kinase